ncbi:C-type lectin-like [Trinorchestia longiramus]|nr:C-type lectin-like [Trinorchestia longiramus]
MLMTPAETSNRNTFERLKTALANIHKNLLNLTKPVNESRASKFVPQKYPTITYHCVLVSKASDKELTAADFSKNDGNVQATNKDDVNHINSLDHSISPNNFINDTSTSNSELRNNQSSLIESGSNSQASSIREDSPAILQLNPHSPATTYKPPLTELMEKLVSPPPNQTPPSCPSLYTPVAHTCLTALPFSMTWQEAGDVCEKLGGQLAEARDITVLTAIARFLQRQGSRSNFWIGGFYDDITSAWMWRSSAKMKMSTPFWGYSQRFSSEHSPLQTHGGMQRADEQKLQPCQLPCMHSLQASALQQHQGLLCCSGH